MIYALATPAGVSALAVFRLSGDGVHEVAHRLSGQLLQPNQAKHAILRDEQGAVLDDVILLYFKGPASATGEDVLEIHCHGSLAVSEALSSYLSRQPHMRAALPGEFTKRGFDNGKMDLTEVEGLADLIDAQTQSQRQQALGQLQGRMRKQAHLWRDEVITLAGRLESLIDFSDEELPETVSDEIAHLRNRLIDSLSEVLADNHYGEIIRSGLKVALLGPVNAGKSTALNALAKRPAAIVSDEAGTTRDIVEVRLDIDGVPVILQDTAGIRQTQGAVESIGIERARQAVEEADLVLLMADGTNPSATEEADTLAAMVRVPMIKIINKSDALAAGLLVPEDYLCLSLHQEDDVAQLEEALAAYCRGLNHSGRQIFITRDRHRRLIETAHQALCQSKEASLDESPELVAEDLRVASDALGQMLGHIDVEDILSDIFSSFCIGK